MDDMVIQDMQQAFSDCSRFYQVVRTHRSFRMVPPEMAEQLRQSEEDIHLTQQRLLQVLHQGQMTPEMVQEAHLYAQCHIEMVMDLLSGLNAVSSTPLN